MYVGFQYGAMQVVGMVVAMVIDRHAAGILAEQLDEGRIVGFSIVLGDLIHLMMIDVALQRLGYGSRLLAWCEAEMRARGHSVARLETFTGNDQAIAFYRKNGWTEKSRDNAEAGPLRRSYWTKRLR